MQPIHITAELARIHRQELLDEAARERRVPRRRSGSRRPLRRR